eukprot:4698850-Pyramimonas_sp.AAC.1
MRRASRRPKASCMSSGRPWPSWMPLGGLGGPLGRLGCRETKKARQRNELSFLGFSVWILASWALFWVSSRASWNCLEKVLEAPGAFLKSSCANLNHLEPPWKPSWALWGPLGAIMGHLERSDRSRGA